MGVHTASAAECAARVPPTAYGFQWDCSGKREKNACIVLRSGADCRFLHASGCGSQVYINASRPVPPAPAPSPHGKHWPEGTGKPTGELCGSAFFVQLNTKLHALQPDNESFAAEIEKTILNVAMAAIDGEHNGHQPVGIRYFANMHKHKQLPTRVASCCENHGTHLLGALPQHIFSLPPAEDTAAGSVVTAARINLFAASRLSITVPGAGGSHVNATVAVETAWPSTPAVTVTVITPAALRAFDLVIRIPGWVSVGSVALTVNGSTWKVAGQPGSYVHLAMSPWPAGETTVAFELPMKLKAHRYVGADQYSGFSRYAYTIGPILLAGTGAWNASMDCLYLPKLDPANPEAWLVRVDATAAAAQQRQLLHYQVRGFPSVEFKPYFAVNANDTYATTPAFDLHV
eukprot:COSAG01_NODE_2292_length_7969_cov_3.362262_6_plen_403_part_00